MTLVDLRHFGFIFACVLGTLLYAAAAITMMFASTERWYYGLIGFLMIVFGYAVEIFLATKYV